MNKIIITPEQHASMREALSKMYWQTRQEAQAARQVYDEAQQRFEHAHRQLIEHDLMKDENGSYLGVTQRMFPPDDCGPASDYSDRAGTF